MPVVVRASDARPLSPQERARAVQVSARLHAELSRAVRLLPEAARSPSAMARTLSIARNTCQRIILALQLSDQDPAVLARAPGVEGLRQFAGAMIARGMASTDAELLDAAVNLFAGVVSDLGGSHARLIARIEAAAPAPTPSAPGGAGDERDRAALFECASRVTGRRCATQFSINAYRLAPEDPSMLERVIVHGMLSSSSHEGGMPMVISTGVVGEDSELHDPHTLDDRPARGSTPDVFLREFTTHPLPMITSFSARGRIQQVIDPAASPCDFAMIDHSRHPFIDARTGGPGLDGVWALMNCPAADLVLDLYLHKRIERAFRVGLDALLWAPDLQIDPAERWIRRTPSQPALEAMGTGIDRAAHPGSPRHVEMTRTMFDRMGWSPSEFVGYRCAVRFPVWRAGYCLRMDPVTREELERVPLA
ncbi:MAG: hypothetical protein RBS39_00760 [Phycisphaerales bacterium]|nr:hypothetical protein [Phycisphaerales bacterium]